MSHRWANSGSRVRRELQQGHPHIHRKFLFESRLGSRFGSVFKSLIQVFSLDLFGSLFRLFLRDFSLSLFRVSSWSLFLEPLLRFFTSPFESPTHSHELVTKWQTLPQDHRRKGSQRRVAIAGFDCSVFPFDRSGRGVILSVWLINKTIKTASAVDSHTVGDHSLRKGNADGSRWCGGLRWFGWCSDGAAVPNESEWFRMISNDSEWFRMVRLNARCAARCLRSVFALCVVCLPNGELASTHFELVYMFTSRTTRRKRHLPSVRLNA